MRFDLPSGNWVEFREKLMAADKFAVQDSITLTFMSGGTQEVTGGIQNKMRNALLGQIITAWSYEGIPIPSLNAGGAEIIGNVMDVDDYNALADEVEGLLEKVSFSPNRGSSTS